jgi:hypothetical protein
MRLAGAHLLLLSSVLIYAHPHADTSHFNGSETLFKDTSPIFIFYLNFLCSDGDFLSIIDRDMAIGYVFNFLSCVLWSLKSLSCRATC